MHGPSVKQLIQTHACTMVCLIKCMYKRASRTHPFNGVKYSLLVWSCVSSDQRVPLFGFSHWLKCMYSSGSKIISLANKTTLQMIHVCATCVCVTTNAA